MKYTVEYARAMLDLNPDWMAIGINKHGDCYWYGSIPTISVVSNYFTYKEPCLLGFLGQFTYDGDWKDTLVVRKCSHKVCGQFTPSSWKYCPKCGELLGSK